MTTPLDFGFPLMDIQMQDITGQETEAAPMCDACGRHPVERKGQLCCIDDKEDLWGCALKAAYFAARWRGIVWAQNSAWDEKARQA